MRDKDPDDLSRDTPPDSDDLDSLSDEEKAAFEKIMAEISVATGGTAPEDPTDSPENKAADATQVASPPPPDSKPTQPPADSNGKPPIESESEDLSDDQLDALNQIMAEIDSKRKVEKTVETEESAAAAGEESLSEDQQDALNQIMAEIDSKRNVDKTVSQPPQKTEVDDASALPDDQQDALNKIMAEIQAKKSRGDEAVTIQDQAGDSGDVLEPPLSIQNKKVDPENLSIEEFDDELGNLLASRAVSASPSNKPPTNQTNQSTAGKNVSTAPDTQAQPTAENQSDNAVTAAASVVPDPVLHEVTVADRAKNSKKRLRTTPPDKRGSGLINRLGRAVVIILVPIFLFILVLGGYYGYLMIRQWRYSSGTVSVDSPMVNGSSPLPAEPQANADGPHPATHPVAQQAFEAPVKTALTTEAWKADLVSAQKQIQAKIGEIYSLKAYYRNGIDEDIKKAESFIGGKTLTFQQAMADRNLDLVIRAVQRRTIYLDKLEIPLLEMGAIAEELLYLERQADLHDTLSKGISGLAKTELQKKIILALSNYRDYADQLSIDAIESTAPDLETTWQQIQIRINQKTSQIARNTPLNQAISTEICKGIFDRKSMLTILSGETARCMTLWNGKDLFLNGLTELSPEAAKILAQWPGEWLSLNGLMSMSTETARNLAQWHGKRLSLNGLTILAPEATAGLSQWEGDQLEMVGLQSIGSWKNYGTRLFLSENLRRRLDLQ